MGHDGDELTPGEREENKLAREEEMEALQAIYADACEITSTGCAASPVPEVRIRVSDVPLVSLCLQLPPGYPSRTLPAVRITAPGLATDERRELARALLGPRAHADAEGSFASQPSPGGSVVMFDWSETLRDLLSRRESSSGDVDRGGSANDDGVGDGDLETRVSPLSSPREGQRSTDAVGRYGARDEGDLPRVEDELREDEDFVEIVHGQAFTDRKSTFQAHLARVTSEAQVVWARRRLLQNGKIARATHNIAAWRVWDRERGVQLHDNDDDGETAAGSRMAHMLAITGAQDVLVVVSRWFGGVHLGPDRFKHINNAARELLVECGATAASAATTPQPDAGGGGGGKHKGRRKRGSGGRS